MNKSIAAQSAGLSAGVSLVTRWLGTLALALGVLLLPLSVSQDTGWFSGSCAVAGNGPGGPGGPGDTGGGDGSGNAGSGKGGSKGGGKSDKGGLFGDMIYITRDVDGVPVVDTEGCIDPIAWDGEKWEQLPLFHEIGSDPTVEEAEGMEAVPDLCLADEYELEANRVRLQKQWRIKDLSKDTLGDQDRDRDRIHDRLALLLQMHKTAAGGPTWNSSLEADDGELGACDVITVCANNTQEVDLGRLSVLRAPERVLDKSRDEVIKVLLKSSGQDSLSLDSSGRLQVDGSTFDSPLINLAFYREFHRFWQLQDTNQTPNAYIVPGMNTGLYHANFDPFYDAYLAMAFGLGGAADKAGSGVDMDVVSRINAILYLPGQEYLADSPGGFPTTLSSDPIEGVVHDFINYRDFSYTREDIWTGCIMYDYYDYDAEAWVYDAQLNILDIFYLDDPDGLEPAIDEPVNNIAGFALAANDARRVLAFVHAIGDDQLRGRVDNVFEHTEAWCP